MRIFKNSRFKKFARKQDISNEHLLEVIERAENGQIDADLGGEVIKQRLKRQGQGKRGGYRTIILYPVDGTGFFRLRLRKERTRKYQCRRTVSHSSNGKIIPGTSRRAPESYDREWRSMGGVKL